MLYTQLVYGTIIITVVVIFHVVSLVFLARLLKRWHDIYALFDRVLGAIVGLGVSVFFIIGIHTVEAWSWAYIYLLLGEFNTINDALYFSISTATTVGYGDVVMSEQWRLLSSFEAIGGWLLFGVSTAFLMGLMRYVFNDVSVK
jgi:voltage-gated potassium channel Kch